MGFYSFCFKNIMGQSFSAESPVEFHLDPVFVHDLAKKIIKRDIKERKWKVHKLHYRRVTSF